MKLTIFFILLSLSLIQCLKGPEDATKIIFVRDEYGSKIIVRQHNKETCELLLTHYFYVFRPKSAIKAAYEYADNKNKIMEVKDYLEISYEDIMWKISHKKLKQHPKGWFC